MDNSKAHVLVVDDRPENLFVMSKILKTTDCILIKTLSGKEGLEMCDRYDFACILLDVQMPEMNGFEFAKKLLEKKGQDNVPPIIFVSAAYQSEDYLLEGYSSGAVDYLLKPINKNILQAKVNIFLRLFLQQQKLNEANQRLDELAHSDPLTKLFNRRQFWISMDAKLAYAKRYQTSVALLLFDLDDFKAMNDSFGHDFGDHVLVTFAKRLKINLRASDCIFRLGGDEFALLIPEAKEEQKLQILAEDLIKRINEPIIYQTIQINPAVSVGIATNEPRDISSKRLYKNADLALYQSKAKGKNISTIYTSNDS